VKACLTKNKYIYVLHGMLDNFTDTRIYLHMLLENKRRDFSPYIQQQKASCDEWCECERHTFMSENVCNTVA
jgi:hypothetical protein